MHRNLDLGELTGRCDVILRQSRPVNRVSIHPWADGNGRMSRSLQTLLIAREGVLAAEFSSIEAWLGRPGNTWEYYRELDGLRAA
jgi:hypothetical protein